MEQFERVNNEKVINLSQVRTDHTMQRAVQILRSLSPEDLHTLQHDVLGSAPEQTRIPACLQEDFGSWLLDSYGPIESETAMAPENRGETETKFLEEASEGDDESNAKMAEFIANGNGTASAS